MPIKRASCSRREASQEARVSRLSSTHGSPLCAQCAPLSGSLGAVRSETAKGHHGPVISIVRICGKRNHVSNRVRLHFRLHVLPLSLCHPLLPRLSCHRGVAFVWFFLTNFQKTKGFLFSHGREEFEAFGTGMKQRSYWAELYSPFLAIARTDIVFVSFVFQVVSVVLVFKYESDPWEKIKVIILSSFLCIF